MIHIFIDDEIVTVESWPLNPQYPLGTWAVNRTDQGDKWYHVARGTFERFWATWPNAHGVPDKHRLQLLLIGD